MTIPSTYTLRRHPDPVLSQVCREVEVGENVTPLAESLQKLCRRHKGLGLAAPQIGDLRRVLFMYKEEMKPGAIMINPEVIDRSKHYDEKEEGCLSFPGFLVFVSRPHWVRVRYLNMQRMNTEETLPCAAARVFLHELDHLNGITIADHAAGKS